MRTWTAVTEQCMNARMPGYTGYIPSARAEDVYGCTQAQMGRTSVAEQSRAAQHRLDMTANPRGPRAESTPALRGRSVPEGMIPDDHPLGKSAALLQRNHWVPTIPGYSGYIPAKHAENICGGGIVKTCKMAGRAIAERAPMPEPAPVVSMQDDVERQRMSEFFHGGNAVDEVNGPSYEHQRLAGHLRDHCEKHIPGYTGHVPRIAGESIYGATARGVNLIAADLCEDRIFNPEAHRRACCAPQGPHARKLRL